MFSKKRFFSIIFSVFFCFAILMGVGYSKDQKIQSVSYAENVSSEGVTTPPSIDVFNESDDVSQKDENGNGWSYFVGEGRLELKNVNWTSQLILPAGSPIELYLNGSNTIEVESGAALNLNGCISITIMGTGSLELLTGGGSAISYSTEEFILDSGVKVELGTDEYGESKDSVVVSDFSQAKKVRFFGEYNHVHDYEFVVSENVLTVKCKETGCSFGTAGYSESLMVEDVFFGVKPSPIFNLEGIRDNTGIDLTDNEKDFTYEYYLETDDGSELVEDSEMQAGRYNLVLTTSEDCEIGEKTLICSFMVNKLSTEITPKNDTVKYNGTRYDLEDLFTIDENAGTKTYSIVEEDSTASGVIEENELIITKAGELKIKVITSGGINYNGSEATAVLTIQKGDLNIGQGNGQVRISFFENNDLEVEYLEKYWTEEDSETVEVVVLNNPGGAVTMTYWLDEDCLSEPTTAEHGAIETNGKPSFKGLYYVKAQIAETGLYNGVSLTQGFSIKKLVRVQVNEDAQLISYVNLVNNEYDLTQLFNVSEESVAAIDSINFYLDVDDEQILIDGSMLEISPIGYNGSFIDEYHITIVINEKKDNLYVFAGESVKLSVVKSELDPNKIGVKDLVYGEIEFKLDIQDNPYEGTVEVKYFYDEECKNLITVTGQEILDVGTYYAEIVISETEYTAETRKVASFKVNKKPVEVIWQEDNFTYNGEVQEIYAQYLDLDKNPVRLAVTTDVEFKNVQVSGQNYSYQAVAMFANGETRYELVGDLSYTYHIKPADIEVGFVEDSVKEYGELSFSMNVELVSGEIFEDINKRMFKYKAFLNDELVEINESTGVGVYVIVGEGNDSNYNITFTNTANLRVKNKFISLTISDWIWGDVASIPTAVVGYGKVNYAYYSGGYEDGLLLQSAPSEPGKYTLVATVENNQGLYGAFALQEFEIHKITINLPEKDSTIYVYDGMEKTYHIDESQINGLYTVSKRTFVNAGNYKIQLNLTDSAHYKWEVTEDSVYELDFIINKKTVEKPAEDNRNFKYSGKALTYIIDQGLYYSVSKNTTQVEPGVYDIRISLVSNNYMWPDGSSDDLVYKFIINQSKIEDSIVTDAEGNIIDRKEASIISIGGSGLGPNDVLKVEIITSEDTEEIKEIRKQLKSKIERYSKIFKVADIKLVRNGDSVQPDNSITLKILVPKELINANFTLYHIHDENGTKIITEVDYTDVDENGYITFQTESLSSFVFVYNQSSLLAPIIIFAVLSAGLIVLLVFQLMRLKNRKKNIALASSAPVFYVLGELVSTIALGVLFGLLIIANIILFILNLKLKKQKENVKEVKTKSSK